MPIKRLIITLENEEGNNAEVLMNMPADIAEEFNNAPMFRMMLDDLFQLTGFGIANIEISEEIRHEFRRRADSGTPRKEIWTEEQRAAYREQLARGG